MINGLRKALEDNPLFNSNLKFDLFQLVFMTPAGKRVLEDILFFCKIDQSAFHQDALTMARNAGKRDVGLYILRTLKIKVNDLEESVNE